MTRQWLARITCDRCQQTTDIPEGARIPFLIISLDGIRDWHICDQCREHVTVTVTDDRAPAQIMPLVVWPEQERDDGTPVEGVE